MSFQAVQEFFEGFEEEKKKLVEKRREFELILEFLNHHAEFHDLLVKKFLQLQNENQELKKSLFMVKKLVLPEFRKLKVDLAKVRNLYMNIPFSGFADLWQELVGILSKNRMNCVNDLWRRNNHLHRSIENVNEKCRITIKEKSNAIRRQSSASNQREMLQKRLKAMNEERSKLSNEVKNVQSELEKSKEREKALRLELKNVTTTSEKQGDIVESLRDKNLLNTTEIQRSEQKIISLEHENTELKDLLERLRREKLTFVQNISKMEREKNQLERRNGDNRICMQRINQGVQNVRKEQVRMMNTSVGLIRNEMNDYRKSWTDSFRKMKDVMFKEMKRRDLVEAHLRKEINDLRMMNSRVRKDGENLRKELRSSINSYSRLEDRYWKLSRKLRGDDF